MCSLQWQESSGLDASLRRAGSARSRGPPAGQAAEGAGRPGPWAAVGAAAVGGQGHRTESSLAPEAVREPHQLHREPLVGTTDGRASLARPTASCWWNKEGVKGGEGVRVSQGSRA